MGCTFSVTRDSQSGSFLMRVTIVTPDKQGLFRTCACMHMLSEQIQDGASSIAGKRPGILCCSNTPSSLSDTISVIITGLECQSLMLLICCSLYSTKSVAASRVSDLYPADIT